MTDSTIERWDEMNRDKPDRSQALQTIPDRRHEDPNWEFYRDPRYMGPPQLEFHNSGLDLGLILKALWHFRGRIMTIGLILATFFVMANHILMPDKYEATARVRVKMPVIIDDNPRARQTVSVIPTEVLSDKVLTQVINDLEMTKRVTPAFIPDLLAKVGIKVKRSVEDGSGIMRWLRQELTIQQSRQGMRTAVFTVSLTSKKPEVAAEIVNAVVKSYMDLRHTFESADASEAVAFLEPQVRAAEATLNEANSRLAKFKLDNSAHLIPSTMIEEQVLALEQEYLNAMNRSDQLREQNLGLVRLRKDVRKYVAAAGAAAADAPSAAAVELGNLRHRLTLAQSRYVAGHPYLRQLAADIKALEKAAARAPRRTATRGSGQVINPEWLRLSQDISANEAEIRVLERNQPVLEQQIERLSEHLAQSSSAQAALLTHQSAWDQAYSRYNQINGQYLNARTQANAQSSDVGKELSILDDATVPTLPITASRTTLQMLGVVGGFAIAFVLILAYLRIKNWEIPEGGRQVGIVASIFLNFFGITWLVALIGYIVVSPYI